MPVDPPPRPPLVVFDFDGTLTTRDTSLSFLSFVAGRGHVERALASRAPLFLFDSIRARRLENGAPDSSPLGSFRGRWGTLVHGRLIHALLGGRERTELEELGRRFAHELMQTDISREGLAQLSWHRSRGHECVLVTASLAVYMEPWGALAGFHHVLATRLAFDEHGRGTGDFDGEPCWGEAKLRRLRAAVGPLEGRTLVAYGDGPGDRALLARADHAMLVDGKASWHDAGAEVRRRLEDG